MDSLPELCAFCVKVELDPLRLSRLGGKQWSLGKGARIRGSACPLCQVVAADFLLSNQSYTSIFEPDVRTLSKEQNVVLTWWPGGAPGTRGGFTLKESRNFICLAEDAHNLESHSELGQAVVYGLHHVPAEFDVGRLMAWMATCVTRHDSVCGSVPGQGGALDAYIPGLDTLRFIDVVDLCVVEMRSTPQFAALSYVWGGVPTLRLTKATRQILAQPGSLRKEWLRIPRTIRDAISLVRSMGWRYLWVDALCLVQNDADDVAKGVKVMDLIYEISDLVIVAAAGHDSSAGLPGIGEGTRAASTATRITEKISVRLHEPLDSLLRSSVYDSRGWTFQEQLLARRAVYFFANRIFFQCQASYFCDELHDTGRGTRGSFIHRKRETWISGLPRAALMERPLVDYEIILEYYTKRQLSNQDDTLQALAGIMRRISDRARCRFLAGLPTAAFDAFLLWENGSMVRRRPGFPSYTWAGWQGWIHYNFGLVYGNRKLSGWLEEKTWIVWYKRTSSSTPPAPVWDPAANEKFPASDELDIFPGYRKRRSFTDDDDDEDDGLPMTAVSTSVTYPTEELSFELAPAPYPYLQFWTLSVRLRVRLDPHSFRGKATIYDRREVEVGKLSADGVDETNFFDDKDDGVFEFAMLSETIFDAERSGDIAGYFVMLLEPSSSNSRVSQRRGLGRIKYGTVKYGFSRPEWKEFFLA